MKNDETVKNVTEELSVIFNAANDALSKWQGETNLQFSVLLGLVAVQLNLNEKQVREADPMVRFYVRKHPDWYVTRGAHGGIMRKSDKMKKDAALASKEALKQQMKAAIEAKSASLSTVIKSKDSPVSDSEDSDVSDSDVDSGSED